MPNVLEASETLLAVAEEALGHAKRLGATEADVALDTSTDFEVKVADGQIVTLTQATGKSLGVRIFVEGRLGFVTTSDFEKASLREAVERGVAMAKEAAIDPHNGLAALSPGRIEAGGELDLYDPKVALLEADEKIAWAHALERAARAADPRVKKFRDSGVSTSFGTSLLVTSSGAVRVRRASNIALWCNPVAEANGELQTEVWYDTKTHVEDLESVEAVGRTAGERAARMLGARRIATTQLPIIFEAPMAAGLIGGMVGALNGDMVYKKASFLADKLGAAIATSALTVTDDPHRRRGLASTPFDGEGLATSAKAVIDAGVLKTFFYDTYTARKAGVQSTANARRSSMSLPHAGPFNFVVSPGDADPRAIWSDVPRALLVTRGLGHGLNSVSGEYSRGVNGLLLEHGEVVQPVQEVTIAGDFLSMLQGIDRIGTDLMVRGSVGAPTLRIAEMMISGG